MVTKVSLRQKCIVSSVVIVLLLAVSCRPDDGLLPENDPRDVYVGNWNFKGNGYSFSGYYIFGEDMEPEWTYTESFSTSHNDSTGSVTIGVGENDLLISYCGTCAPVVYNLNDNGIEAWWINETEFFNDVNPAPPSYSPAYSTYNIQGWKID
jgi:hypothetical protein